jgi:hypothetical protein
VYPAEIEFFKGLSLFTAAIFKHMTFGIQFLSWDRHKNVEEFNRLMDFKLTPLDN